MNEKLVTWASQKHKIVALSTCDVEFMVATNATCQGIWVKRLLSELTHKKISPATLYVDNKSMLDMKKTLYSMEEVSILIQSITSYVNVLKRRSFG